jgi:hypothetical protein
MAQVLARELPTVTVVLHLSAVVSLALAVVVVVQGDVPVAAGVG